MSVECRDWLKTLWAASYKGVPFYFEGDKEKGGRDNVKHVFPNRDDPFIEDLGEALRFYSGSAYVHGDDADSLAAALKAALASRGAGTLVIPYFGPVTVHCETFERATQRDQMGYVAFELEFVRAGASAALVSVPLLQNVAFTAAADMGRLIGALFPAAVTSRGEPDFVIAAATDALAGAAASVDVLRQTYPVAPAASAVIRDTVADLVALAPYTLAAESPPGDAARDYAMSLAASVVDLAAAMPPASAARAMTELAAAFPPPADTYLSATAQRAGANAAAVARLVRLAALTGYAEAILRTEFKARPDGIRARAEVSRRFEAEALDTTGAANAELFVAIETLRGAVIEWLMRTINDLAPIVVVESAISRPSLALAWILYADPFRAAELVARNEVRHASFMPRRIEALSR